MEYGKVEGLDTPVSRIVFGTDRLRGRRWRWVPDTVREHQAGALLDNAFDLGCNAFDTARAYGDSERTLGQWMRDRRNRDRVVVITKGCHPRRGRGRLSPDELSNDLHHSLRALRTDFIDVYLLHYDDPSEPVEPVMERLHRHVGEGKIRVVGASNWAHERIAAANRFAADRQLTPFTAASVQFSLAEWTKAPWPGAITLGGPLQDSARRWYAERDIAVFAWSSLARGFFSDDFQPQRPGINDVTRWCATHFGSPDNLQRLARARQCASDHQATVAQIALAYALQHPLRLFVVVGCSTTKKLAENVEAFTLQLDPSALQWLATGQS